MNVRCPSCSRLYRVADERVASGAVLRCTGCGHQFSGAGSVEAAAPPPASPFARPEYDRRRARATPGDVGGPGPLPAQTAVPAEGATSNRVALLADAGRPFRSTIRPVLERSGFRVVTVEQGTEAFRLAVAKRPAVVVASVHLAGLSGVAICEGIKQSPHLNSIAVVLVGSQDTADLFNHDTALGYGADLFLDEAMREDEMQDRLGGLFGPADAPAPDPGDDEIAPVLAGLGEAAAPGTPREEIRRLARIMLSDLRLYNPDRFRQALDEGRLLEVFKVELARGRDIVDQRFPEVAGRQDQLANALHDGIEQERDIAARG